MEPQPNLVAYVSLLLVPLWALALTATLRPAVAVPIILFGAQMFLPARTAIDLPVLPPIDKDLIPALFALLGCLVFRPKSLRGARPFRGYDLLVIALSMAFLATTLTNPEPLRWGPTTLKGMVLYDFANDAIKVFLYWWTPFFLGRNLYKTSADLRRLFVIIAAAGLIYIPFLLIEFRFSPQLHRWVYGFHQHDFIQTLRGDSYRPMVFMNHGLNVALFMLTTVFAAAGLARIRQRVGKLPALVVCLLLLLVLLFFRSAGATVYALVGLTLIWGFGPRNQMRVAAALALVVLTYPLIRALELLPVDDTLSFFEAMFGEERSASLGTRLRNEGILLAHATRKLLFGWGGYARNFVYDPVTGSRTTIVDGYWILTIGARGLVGFLAIFILLLLPVWRARAGFSRLANVRDRKLLACLTVMVALCVADQIPNATIDPYAIFLAGVLSSLARGLRAEPGVGSSADSGVWGPPGAGGGPGFDQNRDPTSAANPPRSTTEPHLRPVI